MEGLHWEETLNARNYGISLNMPPGRVLAVIDPNGAGKSMLLDLLRGLLKPDHGHLDISGQILVDSRRFIPAHRRRISLLGQQPLLFLYLDVLSNVVYGPRARGPRRDNTRALALEMLDRMGAAALASCRPGEPSGGQVARVVLARALTTKSRAVPTGEPLATVDVEYTPRLRVAVKAALVEVEYPRIIVTHDPADIAALTDDVAALDNGRTVEHGSATEVMAYPESSFGKLLFTQK